jgi:alpha-ketoglutarate-dependent taurine dioxygenase
MYYKKVKPKLLWFYCETPASSGGETTLCDGIQYCRELQASTQILFNTKRIKYIRKYRSGLWQEIYQTDDLGKVANACDENDLVLTIDDQDHSIVTEYVTSAIVKSRCGNHDVFINNIFPVAAQEFEGKEANLIRFEDGSKIPLEVFIELKEIADKLTVAIDWEPGEFVMIDNTWLLHGRKPFIGNERQVFTRLCDPGFPF